MNKIFAWFFSLILLIIPSWKKHSPKLDVDKAVAEIISAIKTRDIDTIESFMCKNIKDNVPDLKKKIGKMVDAVDGKITSVSTKSSEVFYSSKGAIHQSISNSIIKTSITTYYLDIRWETKNNYLFEERGIRYIELYIKSGGEYKLLVEINATEWN